MKHDAAGGDNLGLFRTLQHPVRIPGASIRESMEPIWYIYQAWFSLGEKDGPGGWIPMR